ncbi:uncharacterized protein LOC115244734 [Formica exsecta]|uniref:uncharacterized protein LOC115244734 n=1 Tax=Formica exsecta TaxID=72781 RepID=UPI0011433E9B|nr:uncharacterized protein LOC115244734 [Formica exsecta]
MEIISGKRKGSYLYVYEGCTYNIDKRYNYIYRYAKRRITACKGLLIKENEKFIVDCTHNHPSELYISDILNLKKEMLQMCKETTITNKEIFDTVCQKNPNAAANISYHAMRNLLSREKIKMRPPLPLNVCDLGDLLQDYEPTKYIYKGCVISEDNKYSYILTSDKLLRILEKCSEIFIDGTFTVVPRAPNFAQLFSVHVRYMDKGIAVLFILCEARTQLVYKSIWKEIIKLVPDLQCNLRFIMMDYEKASMNAIHEQFPHASLRGCWFHYCQAVLKRWKRLGLLKAPGKIVSMAMTLALAPPEMFSEGLTLMQIIADEESDNYPNMLLFMKYMRSTWLPISNKISVYGCPIRTNNLVESFHNIMTQKMQTVHPNLWIFLDNISKLITDQEINYDRLLNGLQITRNRCRFNKYRNTKIREAQNYLSIVATADIADIEDESQSILSYSENIENIFMKFPMMIMVTGLIMKIQRKTNKKYHFYLLRI